MKFREYLISVLAVLTVTLSGCSSSGNSSSNIQSQSVPEANHSEITTRPPSNVTPSSTTQPLSDTNSSHKETKSTKQNVSNQNEAYLTFDDGPSANTGRILDTLKAYRVKATFFVNGTDNEDEKAFYKRIKAEGHAIGLHGYSHDYATVYRSVDAFKADIVRLNKLLKETVGYQPNILRFPGGSNNTVSHKSGGKDIMNNLIKLVKDEGYTYFDWNVDSKDAEEAFQDRQTIVRSVLKESNSKKKIIVLMHDLSNKGTTVDALPDVIEGLQKRGYSFKTLSKQSFNYKLK